MKKNLIIVFIGLVVVFAGSLLWTMIVPHFTIEPSGTTEDILPPESETPDNGITEDETLLTEGKLILQLLADKNFSSLAQHVGENGLTILPYPFLSEKSVFQNFFAPEVSELPTLTGEYLRGYADGSGFS